MTKKELEEENRQLKQKYMYYYNANKQKKEDNNSLRGEVRVLKKQVIDLTVMVNYLRGRKC